MNDWYCTDSEGAVKVPSSGSFASAKLNLNGHTIKSYGGRNPAIVMGAVGENESDTETKTLEILNGTIKTSWHGAAVCGSNKSLTLDGVTLTTAPLTTTGDKMHGLFTNGKTLTNTNAGKATVSIAGGAVATVKNGTVIGGTSWYTIEVRKNSAASLTLEDVTAAAGLCFGDASNLLVTFSTPGPDRYADGSTVRDGERYALVYVRGTFGGIAADGSAVEADDAVVAVLSRAEKGRCPTTVFQVPSDLAKTLTGGSYAVYLLDTRLAPTDAVRLAATDAKTGLPTAIAATTEVATKPLSAAGGLWLRSRYAILSRKLSFCAQDEKAN